MPHRLLFNSEMAAFLWRHKWKTLLGVTVGVGAGLYYNRGYIFQKVGQAVADYSKGMVENIKKEEEQKNTEEHFEKIQTRCLGHTLQFLRALREHLSITLDVRPTLKLLKKATEDKDLEQKVVYWKTLLDLKIARVICGALAICVLDTSFRVQFSILHRESRKLKKKAAGMPMIEEVKDDDETKGEEDQVAVDISAETRAEFIEKGWSSISEDLDVLAKNVLQATAEATKQAGWEGEKFKSRVSYDEIISVVDNVMDTLKDAEGIFVVYKLGDHTDQAPSTRSGATDTSADGSSILVSTMIGEAKHMMRSPMFTFCLTSSCDRGIDVIKAVIYETIKADTKQAKATKEAAKETETLKLFLAYVPKAMDRVRAKLFVENMLENQIINGLKKRNDDLVDFCAAIFETDV